jgi:hypothetical protein
LREDAGLHHALVLLDGEAPPLALDADRHAAPPPPV